MSELHLQPSWDLLFILLRNFALWFQGGETVHRPDPP
jgi:hypothetical protein